MRGLHELAKYTICRPETLPAQVHSADALVLTGQWADELEPGYEIVPFDKSHPRMASSWQFIGPEALYWAPRHVHKIWNVKEIFISENGCGTADDPAANGIVFSSELPRVACGHAALLEFLPPSAWARRAASSSDSGSSNSAMMPYKLPSWPETLVSVSMRWLRLMHYLAHLKNRNGGQAANEQEH